MVNVTLIKVKVARIWKGQPDWDICHNCRNGMGVMKYIGTI